MVFVGCGDLGLVLILCFFAVYSCQVTCVSSFWF